MMICDECNQRPASMHFTKIVNGEKTELHLCEHCAREKGEMFMMQGGPAFSFNNLLSGLFNFGQSYQQPGQEAMKRETVAQCPNCSMTFPQFAKIGKFGCADCYEAFAGQLRPMMRRLHGGNTEHQGKIPKRIGATFHIRRQLEESKAMLKELISREEFEKAAEMRDHIRQLENEIQGTDRGGS